MTRGYRRLILLAVAGAAGTGLPLLVYRQLLPAPAGDALAHPGESLALYAHVIVAPWLLFACGVLWGVHVLPRLRDRSAPRRPTGILLALALVPIVLAGYLAQVVEAEPWHALLAAVHGFGATAWIALFALHLLGAKALARTLQRRSSAPME